MDSIRKKKCAYRNEIFSLFFEIGKTTALLYEVNESSIQAIRL